MILLLVIIVSHAGANSWQDVAQVNQDIKAVQNDIESGRKIIQDEQEKLKDELSALRNEVSQAEKTVQALKGQFEELLQNEEKLRKNLEAEEEEIQTLEKSLRTVAIEKYISGQSDHLPLDLTGGVIAGQADQNHKIREWLEAGGILVWPILLIGAAAILLSLERIFSLGRIPTKTDKIMDSLSDLVLKGNWQEGRELCDKISKFPPAIC